MFATINGLFGPVKALSGLAPWLIRLPWGAVFLYHGVTKFTGESGIDGFAGMLSQGFGAAGYPMAVAVAVAEILAGFGMIAGGLGKAAIHEAATRLAGLAATIVMIGALVIVRLPSDGGWRGMEFDVLLLGVALYFMIRGND